MFFSRFPSDNHILFIAKWYSSALENPDVRFFRIFVFVFATLGIQHRSLTIDRLLRTNWQVAWPCSCS